MAFLDDFALGRAMVFELKTADTYEAFAKSGKFSIRFVDAKFAFPKREDALDREYVSLELLEYPGEHDDIVIGFDAEEGKSSSAIRTCG